MDFVKYFKEKAKSDIQRIVLAEGTEERTLKAADIVLGEGFADLIILSKPDFIKKFAADNNLKNLCKATIIDPENNPKAEEYANLIYELRKKKGMDLDTARKLVKNPLYLASAMIKAGDADGEVAGAENSTGNVLRPALQLIKTMPGISVVSGAFIIILKDTEFGENGVFLFADCAVTPVPDEKQLAEIAVTSAKSAKDLLGMDARIAMLSFSSHGSASHEVVDKVSNATKLAKEMNPALVIDGELQFDAAVVPNVAAKKAPDSVLQGKANVLIFPNLEAGNIAYKMAQRFGHAEAYGPILQGMAAPVNDLSRGCYVSDIVNVIAITATQAIGRKNS